MLIEILDGPSAGKDGCQENRIAQQASPIWINAIGIETSDDVLYEISDVLAHPRRDCK